MKRAVVLTSALALASCGEPARSYYELDAAGYTHIKLTGWSPFLCDFGNDTETFVADAPNGHRMHGVVCIMHHDIGPATVLIRPIGKESLS